MTFKDQIAADLDAVFFNADEFAETVTYNGSEITAVVDYGPHPYESDGALGNEATLHAKTADVALPAYRDTVEINSVTWRVSDAPKGGGGSVWEIRIVRDVRHQFSGGV